MAVMIKIQNTKQICPASIPRFADNNFTTTPSPFPIKLFRSLLNPKPWINPNIKAKK